MKKIIVAVLMLTAISLIGYKAIPYHVEQVSGDTVTVTHLWHTQTAKLAGVNVVGNSASKLLADKYVRIEQGEHGIYVYADGEQVQETLIKSGEARISGDLKYTGRYYKEQGDAQLAKKGIWKSNKF